MLIILKQRYLAVSIPVSIVSIFNRNELTDPHSMFA